MRGAVSQLDTLSSGPEDQGMDVERVVQPEGSARGSG